ncbi:unnamed protein product [Nezara viridula]|uniref:Uncharacterized protein n=1 Tax=Nezara viridula TaxID=85310 RepID=A0A9P0HPV6_NEZVI|nr:unnamed protein product [Nezara viridula]
MSMVTRSFVTVFIFFFSVITQGFKQFQNRNHFSKKSTCAKKKKKKTNTFTHLPQLYSQLIIIILLFFIFLFIGH